MPRKARAEVEGGLYHVLTRGNNRRQIFSSPNDYQKFLTLLAKQRIKPPFFLYAYCLMTNHVHLLIERQASAVGRIMHRLLTGYAQYYNRRYRRVDWGRRRFRSRQAWIYLWGGREISSKIAANLVPLYRRSNCSFDKRAYRADRRAWELGNLLREQWQPYPSNGKEIISFTSK